MNKNMLVNEMRIKDINNEIKNLKTDNNNNREIRYIISEQKYLRQLILSFLNNYGNMSLKEFKEKKCYFVKNFESDFIINSDDKVIIKYHKYYVDKYEKELYYLENLYTLFTD